jgi:hypothetical protein
MTLSCGYWCCGQAGSYQDVILCRVGNRVEESMGMRARLITCHLRPTLRGTEVGAEKAARDRRGEVRVNVVWVNGLPRIDRKTTGKTGDCNLKATVSESRTRLLKSSEGREDMLLHSWATNQCLRDALEICDS